MDMSSPVTSADVAQDPAKRRGNGRLSALSVMRLAFTAFWVFAFAYAAWASREFAANSGVFPGVISLIGLLIAAAALVSAVRAALRERAGAPAAAPAPIHHSPDDAASDAPNSVDPELALAGTHHEPPSFALSARYGAWLLGLVLTIWLVGAVIAAGLFVAAFLAVEARASWKWVVAGPILMMVGLIALANGINLHWPETLLRL